MKRLRRILYHLAALAAVLSWAPQARAYSAYYTNGVGSNLACTTCHSSTQTTCNGCHSHGTHPDQTKSSIDVTATADKTTYQPGETVTVTVNGGYRTGWVRVNLYDGSMALLTSSCPTGPGSCYSSTFPATLTAPAPTTPGTYTWRASWYGNAYDASGAYFSPTCGTPAVPPCFRVDPGNNIPGAVHGEELVAVTQFTVASAAPAPSISVTPTSLSFGNVAVGGSGTRTLTIANGGTATLTGNVALAAGTTAEFAVSPASFSIAAGGAPVTVTVTYAPSAVGADSGAIAVTSNDPATPTANVAVSGTGVTTPVPVPIASLSPTSIDFGATTIGATASHAVTIQNTGTATLDVTGISLASGTSAEFAWSPAAPFTVAAGASTTVTVTYQPTDGGTDAGAVVIATDDPASPTLTVAVSGSGAQAAQPHQSSGGCGSGGSAGWLALAALALLGARRLGLRSEGAVR